MLARRTTGRIRRTARTPSASALQPDAARLGPGERREQRLATSGPDQLRAQRPDDALRRPRLSQRRRSIQAVAVEERSTVAAHRRRSAARSPARAFCSTQSACAGVYSGHVFGQRLELDLRDSPDGVYYIGISGSTNAGTTRTWRMFRPRPAGGDRSAGGSHQLQRDGRSPHGHARNPAGRFV